MKNGLHHWIEDRKTYKIDLNFASFGFTNKKIWISKVHLFKIKKSDK
jgi:hypothetical protein